MDFGLNIGIEEYKSRLAQLKEGMEQRGIDIALFFFATDIYYFSGTAVLSTLVIPLKRDPVLLVRIGYERALDDTWLLPGGVRVSQGLTMVRDVVCEMGKGTVIGVTMDVMTISLFKNLKSLLPESQFKDISSLVLDIRLIKSQSEIELVKKAALISAGGFQYCCKDLCEGMTEIEVQSEIEKVQRRLGCDEAMVLRHSHPSVTFGVVASGPNTAVMSGTAITISGRGTSPAHPQGASSRKLQKGDLVCINKGTSFQGYHADEARTYVVGKASDMQKRLFDIDLRIQEAAFEAVKPGNLASDVYNSAKKVAVESGCQDYFMGYGQYGVEYVGHGVGLEIDEPPLVSPDNNIVLKPGMVIALEPKFILPGWGGIDMEDTIVITTEGNEVLTRTPREIIEIPA